VSSRASAASGRRRPSRPSRTSSGASRANRPKRTQPRLGAVAGHRREGEAGVDERRGRDVGRFLAVTGDELEPREREDPGGGRPAPEPLGVRTAGAQPQQPAEGAPRVECAEHVAEEDAREHEADPEDDEDERRREVGGRRRGAREPADDHEHEEAEPERLGCEVDGSGGDGPPERTADRLPAVAARGPLVPRGAPEGRQRDERHDQHDAGGEHEQPLGDRQVSALDEAVGVRGRGDGEEGEDDGRRRGDGRAPGGGNARADPRACAWASVAREDARAVHSAHGTRGARREGRPPPRRTARG
jgi:hypothetical protein